MPPAMPAAAVSITRGQVAGAEKGDAQECHKEHQRRAEVAHQRQAAHTEGGEQRWKIRIPLGEKPVQRGRAHQHEHQLHQPEGCTVSGPMAIQFFAPKMRWPTAAREHQQPPPGDGGGQRSRTASGRLRSATLSMRK